MSETNEVKVNEVELTSDEQKALQELRKINITANERKLILAIRDSEYNGDGGLAPVWVNCMWGWYGKRIFSGVMSSLVKKGLAGSDGECCWLTKKGLDAVSEEPYKCTIDRAHEDGWRMN